MLPLDMKDYKAPGIDWIYIALVAGAIVGLLTILGLMTANDELILALESCAKI